MTTYLPIAVRRLVTARAANRCEYCRIHANDTFVGLQVDHIISEKHGGRSDQSNLALCCAFCNRNKGSDLGSIIHPEPTLIRFYSPRRDTWEDHFEMRDYKIVPRTKIGVVTVQVFQFNVPERLEERRLIQGV